MALIECTECKQSISDTASSCPACGKQQKDSPKNKSVVRRIFEWMAAIVILMFFIGFLIGLAGGGRSEPPRQSQTPSNQSNSNTTGKPSAPVQALEVSISQLLSDYDSNEVHANTVYKGKTIKVLGLVSDVKKDLGNNLYVLLGTGSEQDVVALQAYFDDAASIQLAQLKKNQRLNIMCEITGLMFNVIGQNCKIVQS
jgi:tRNA_anti-like